MKECGRGRPWFAAILLFFTLFPVIWGANAGGALTLDEAYSAALGRSEIIATQVELINQAEEHYKQAVGSVLPAVNLNASYLVQQTPQPASPFFPSTEPLVQLQAIQPLFRGLREFAGLRMTKLQKESQLESARQARLQLSNDVAQAFYNVLSLEKDLQDLHEEVTFYETRIRELNARVRIGRSRVSETLTVESALSALQAQIKQEEGQVVAAREELAFLTGLPASTPLANPPGPLPEPGSLDKYTSRIEERPDVRTLARTTEANEEGIAIARGAHYPSVTLTGDYYPVRYGPQQNVNWDVSVGLTVPLYAGGTIQSQVRQAASVARQSDLALSNGRRAAVEEIRSLYATYQADLAQIQALQKNREISDNNYRVQTRDYRLGQVTNLDVVTALTAFQESVRSLDRAIFTARYDLNRLQNAGALPVL